MKKSSLTEEEQRLCVLVAKLYYENGLTQDEIGARLGFSRVKINRVLRQARDAGIVEVRIQVPSNSFYPLENSLIVRFGLRDAIVVPEMKKGSELYLALAEGASYWLKQHIAPGVRIGLGMGRTISHLPQVFHLGRPVACTFTEVVGAASDHAGEFASYNISSKMAELAGGRSEFFYAPTFVSDPELKRKLMAEPSVINALERARKCDIILQSVGLADESALLYVHHYISSEDLKELQRLGAVGDALGHYFDRKGNPISSFADERVIGIELEDIRRTPWSVLLAGGKEKLPAISGALAGRYFNVLVTDCGTAQALLAEDVHAQ